MITIMKKALNILFGALAVIALASCAKEEKLFQNAENGEVRTFSCSFDQAASKTNLVDGKTVWAKGDSIWVSNGRGVEKFGVPESADGQKQFTFTSKLGGAIYVVYPLSAVKGEGTGLVDGKIVLNVPSDQAGNFATANISVAKTLDETVVLKNATAVMKFTIPGDALIPVMAVILHANGNALTGLCSIDIESGTPVITASQTGSDVFVPVKGLNGDFYATVIPGNYKEGFSLTAVTTALQVDSKASASANEVKVNDLIDLGNIGVNLQKLSGDGSAASPWQINNFGEMLAFAYHVNAGNDMAGQSVKLNADIEGYSLPIGFYDEVANKYVSFKGAFDGGNKTIKVDINGANCRTDYNVGLFSVIEGGASIKDLTVDGVVAGVDTVGAVAGQVMAGEEGFVVSNVKNKATVSGRNMVAGLFGYVETEKTNVVTIDDCTNEGAVTATGIDAAGLAGYFGGSQYMVKTVNHFVNKGVITASASAAGAISYAYFADLNDCENSGAVTSTATNGGNFSRTVVNKVWQNSYGTNWNRGTGGLVGYMQNSNIINCKNTAAVSGYNKTGGIVGVMYWGKVDKAVNSGNVTTTGAGVAGGIASWMFVSYGINNCVNNGAVSSKGGWNGGIVGYAHSGWSNEIMGTVNNCKNTGKIEGGQYTGGIAGNVWVAAVGCKIDFNNCTNTADIVSTSNGVAGIAGYVYDATGWCNPNFYECINDGNIKGTYYVGGICGYMNGRVVNMKFAIRNSVNNGTITATRTDAQPSYSGGLVGCMGGATNASCGLQIDNSINNGDVYFSTTSYAQPRVAGIIGQMRDGVIRNVVNTGKVALVGGATPSADQLKQVGSIIGYMDAAASGTTKKVTIKGAFGLAGTTTNLIGTSCTFSSTPLYYSFFNAEGAFTGDPVTVNEIAYTNVVDALNAVLRDDVKATTWYNWIAGPRFGKPVGYGVNIGDQNLDLGNGGNI